jgi:hypothetical protein
LSKLKLFSRRFLFSRRLAVLAMTHREQIDDRSFVMKARERNGASLKSTILVAVALTVALLLAVSFLIATGVRGGGVLRPFANATGAPSRP